MRDTGHSHAGSRRRIRTDATRGSMRRRLLIALGSAALASPLSSIAQLAAKTARIGFFYFGTRQSALDGGRYQALVEGLRDLGYVEGKNLVIESRFADGKAERTKALAAELVQLKVDVFVATGSATYRSLQQAAPTTPIVITVTADPVAGGYAASMARPGGNITGFSDSGADIVAKYLELLRAAAPKLSRVGVLLNPANVTHATQLVRIISAAQKIGIRTIMAEAATEQEIAREFTMLTRDQAGAVIVLNDTYFFQQLRQIAALALKHRLPSIYSVRQYAEAGGLMSYGPNITDNFRRAATYVDKILKGAKAGELPFEQPMRFYLFINGKTAKSLGVAIPQELLLRAEKVIE